MKDLHPSETDCRWRGVHYGIVLSAAATGGTISVTEVVSPASEGPPRHIHHAEDETFVILSGDVEFWAGGRSFFRGPGECAFVPRGTEHTFRVTDDGPARFLCILTPGGFENFFFEGAHHDWSIPGDMEAIEEAASRYNLEFTGPPIGG